MSWPTPQAYNEAIQNNSICFKDPELRQGISEKDKLGLPRPRSGSFASVYRFKCGHNDWAVRCFYTQVHDQAIRYEAISNYLKRVNLPYFVPFEYITEGILVQGKWYPIVKMKWIQGETIISYLQRHLHNPAALNELSYKWLKMIQSLQNTKIAHGDLQHGNILILGDEFKLIDYDGMFVPSLQGFDGSEVGHRNYQHPERKNANFGAHIDNFSAWVIFTSIKALAIDASLWDKIEVSEDKERLLLGRDDFISPQSSPTFQLLRGINDSNFSKMIDYLQYASTAVIDSIQSPIWYETLNSTHHHTGTSTRSSAIPNWLEGMVNGQVETSSPSPLNATTPTRGSSWIHDHLQGDHTLKKFEMNLLRDRLVSLPFILIPAAMIILLNPTLLFFTAVVFTSSALLIAYNYSRYIRIPVVQERKQLADQIRSIKSILNTKNSDLNHLIEERSEAEADKTKKYNKLYPSIREAEGYEKKALDSIDKRLKQEINNINNKNNSLSQQETTEINNAAKLYQDKWLKTNLASHTIEDAKISGIGNGVKRNLAMNGLNNAADFVDVKCDYQSYSVYSNPTAYIILTNGKSIHVDGIGQTRARDLLSWRNTILQYYQKKMPNLPRVEIDSIRDKYKKTIENLQLKIKQAEQTAINEKNTVIANQNKEKTRLKNEIESTERKFKQMIQSIDHKIQNKKNEISNQKFEEDHLQRKLRFYRQIRFSSYLFKVLFLRK
jgi:hypothetical protein